MPELARKSRRASIDLTIDYQTGADPWGLFAFWALFIAPWAVAACFTPLWLVEIALIDVALVLFWQQAIEPGRNGWMSLFCVALAPRASSVTDAVSLKTPLVAAEEP